MRTFKFLETLITDDLLWSAIITATVKEAQQRLVNTWRGKTICRGGCQSSAAPERSLTYCISFLYQGCSAADTKKALQRIIMKTLSAALWPHWKISSSHIYLQHKEEHLLFIIYCLMGALLMLFHGFLLFSCIKRTSIPAFIECGAFSNIISSLSPTLHPELATWTVEQSPTLANRNSFYHQRGHN